jgi:hypothetical protein
MATVTQRPAEPVVHARVPRELREEFEALARRNHRSLAGETRVALERHVYGESAATRSAQRV